MKKTLANDPIFINAIMNKDGSYNDYYIKNTTHYVKFENGMIYCFEKENIQTTFCFGYGQCGRYSEKEEIDATERCKAIEEKKNFIAANMRKFDVLDEIFNCKFGPNVYASINHGKCAFLFNERAVLYNNWYKDLKKEAYILTETDVKLLKEGIVKAKQMFMKRLETYWKRFNSSKLHTWTYISD